MYGIGLFNVRIRTLSGKKGLQKQGNVDSMGLVEKAVVTYRDEGETFKNTAVKIQEVASG